jgi:hypothetical protein
MALIVAALAFVGIENAAAKCESDMKAAWTCNAAAIRGEPQIANLVEICEKDGTTFIAMEAQDGASGIAEITPESSVWATLYPFHELGFHFSILSEPIAPSGAESEEFVGTLTFTNVFEKEAMTITSHFVCRR